MSIKLATIEWNPIWRIIPSRFPPVDLFHRIADSSDFAAIIEIESMTNDRLRAEKNEIEMISPDHVPTGPGSSYIMAAFSHLNPVGSRFSDGSFGVFYGAYDYLTAVAESKFHRAQFLSATKEAPIEIDMRVLKAKLSANLHDIRKRQNNHQDIYAKNDYAHSQNFAKKLRADGSSGIAYSSVRCEREGDCAAIFLPDALSNCQADHHLCYVWNGSEIVTVYKKSLLS